MGGGISTSNCALRIDWSLSRKVATILACESSVGRLSQASYMTYLVTTLERFAESGSENPPLVTHPLMPGTSLSTASISADTWRTRSCDAPAGSCATTTLYPWSSMGRNAVGCRAKRHPAQPTTTQN